MFKLAALWGASALLACDAISMTSDPVDPNAPDAGSSLASALALPVTPAHDATCTGTPAAGFAGTASRANDNGYPDAVDADVTWTLSSTSGCVDTYVPSGTVTYGFAIPGALCDQSVDPPTHAIAAGDGTLTVDRATSPPTYTIHAATTWPITWYCTDQGNTQTQSLTGGGVWIDAAALAGTFQKSDQAGCGAPNGTPPCTYAWDLH